MTERITQIMLGVLILLALVAVAILQTGHRENMYVQRQILERLETLEALPITTAVDALPPDDDGGPKPVADAGTSAGPTDPPDPPPPVVIDDPTPRPGADERPPIDIVGIGTPRPVRPSADDPVASPPADDPITPSPTDAVVTGNAAEAWQRFGPTIETALANLLAGKYADVNKQFTEPFAKSLDPMRLAAAFNPVRQRAGGFERVVEYESMGSNGNPAATQHPFRVVVATEKNQQLTFSIIMTSAKQIDSLFIN